MKTLFAGAILILLLLNGPAFCFSADLAEVGDAGAVEVTPDEPPAPPQESVPPADTATEDAEPKTDQPAGQTLDETDDKKPPMDVMRHRPGACPEGPPCKEGN